MAYIKHQGWGFIQFNIKFSERVRITIDIRQVLETGGCKNGMERGMQGGEGRLIL